MSSQKRNHRALVLVVERDPYVRMLEAYFLHEAGFEAEFVGDGEEALRQAKALKPDIVIAELLVPKLDGLGLCQALKADSATSNIPVILFSFLAAHERAREAGAACFLLKPVSEERLVSAVDRILDTRNGNSGKELT